METKYILLIAAIVAYVLLVWLFSLLGNKRDIGSRRLFWISLFLTPIIGLTFLLSAQHRKLNAYTEERFKCESCGYVFSENHEHCPICEKEGRKNKLTPVNMLMT
jgi:hypothetical protein